MKKWQDDSEKHQEFYNFMHKKVEQQNHLIAKQKSQIEQLKKQNDESII